MADPKRKKRPRPAGRLVGDALVVEHEARLPDVCLKCGSQDAITKRPTTFYWAPLWARVFLFLYVGFLLAVWVRREADLAVPLCPACTSRWNTAHFARIGIVALAVGSLMAIRQLQLPKLAYPVALIAVMTMVVFAFRYLGARMLRVKFIDKRTKEIHFVGVHESAAREVVEGARD